MSARQALLDLCDEHGALTPDLVVEAATPAKSPLHEHFEWNNTTAAAQYRRHQARQLIRRYKITIETAPDTFVAVRQFTNVPVNDGDDRAYITTVDVMSDELKRNVALQEARRQLAALRRKYQHLIDWSELLRQALDDDATAA